MSRLLIVDDEQAICWGIAKLGQSEGHEVHTASSAEEGLLLAEQHPPDAIVLDVRLPGMTGLEAMQHFRQRAGQVPIVVVTAYGDLHTAVEAVKNGAFDYLVKPFDLDQVQAVLARALLKIPDRPADGD
ncbi:MAG: response regulator, partial [Planctomycetia bacterium]|nr:response regulator [Planctomycetia bacterium]